MCKYRIMLPRMTSPENMNDGILGESASNANLDRDLINADAGNEDVIGSDNNLATALSDFLARN